MQTLELHITWSFSISEKIFQVWDSHRYYLFYWPISKSFLHGTAWSMDALKPNFIRQMKDKKNVKTGNNAGHERKRERVSEHNEQQVLCGQSAGKLLRFGSDVGWMMELMDEITCLCYSPPPSFPHHPALFHIWSSLSQILVFLRCWAVLMS